MDLPDLYILDPSTGIRLSYLAEGAANIVYRPIPSPSSPSQEADIGFDQVDDSLPPTPPPTEISPPTLAAHQSRKLIRLRKALPTTVPVSESWSHFQHVIRPLFSETELVSQTLFKISPNLLQDCNADLRSMEAVGQRNPSRHGLYLAEDEEYGTLIDDMTSSATHLSIEFKPKWLLQSPNAPATSERCRTCALRAMKVARAREKDAMKGGFCPLKLVSGDMSGVADVVEALMGGWIYSDMERMRVGDRLMSWARDAGSGLLGRLRELQGKLDGKGVLEADVTSGEFETAMTLRDCTLFLKVCCFPPSNH